MFGIGVDEGCGCELQFTWCKVTNFEFSWHNRGRLRHLGFDCIRSFHIIDNA